MKGDFKAALRTAGPLDAAARRDVHRAQPGADEISPLRCWASAADEVRLPLVAATDAARATIRAALASAGIKSKSPPPSASSG